MKKALITLSLALLMASCKKDYTVNPPFSVGETVLFNDINPSKSFIPLKVYCPCKVVDYYQEAAYYGWWYDVTDINGNPVTHLYQDQLKKY